MSEVLDLGAIEERAGKMYREYEDCEIAPDWQDVLNLVQDIGRMLEEIRLFRDEFLACAEDTAGTPSEACFRQLAERCNG